MRQERAYLLQMARRLFLDHYRRRASRQRLLQRFSREPIAGFMLPPALEDDSDPVLERALARLPEIQRTVLHLKIWEELTFCEIAALLEIPKGTVVSRYQAALDKIRSSLSNTSSDWTESSPFTQLT